MDCTDVERALIDGQPVGEAARAHAADCETCRFLLSDGGGPLAQALAGSLPPAPAVDLEALRADVVAGVRAERGPVAAIRSWPRAARLVVAAVVMAAGALFFYVMMKRPDWEAYGATRMALTLGSLGAAALVLTWVTLRPAYLPPVAPRTVRGLAVGAALLPVVLALLPGVPSPIDVPGFSYLRSGYLCFSIGAGMSLLCLLAAGVLDRGGHRNLETAMLAALGCGMIGVIAGTIFCPVNAPLHLLTGHASIPAGLALGYLAFRRL